MSAAFNPRSELLALLSSDTTQTGSAWRDLNHGELSFYGIANYEKHRPGQHGRGSPSEVQQYSIEQLQEQIAGSSKLAVELLHPSTIDKYHKSLQKDLQTAVFKLADRSMALKVISCTAGNAPKGYIHAEGQPMIKVHGLAYHIVQSVSADRTTSDH